MQKVLRDPEHSGIRKLLELLEWHGHDFASGAVELEAPSESSSLGKVLAPRKQP